MKVKNINGKWWITDMPNGELNCGAYETKAEAEEDRAGMQRFSRYEDEPGYVTCETVQKGDLESFL